MLPCDRGMCNKRHQKQEAAQQAPSRTCLEALNQGYTFKAGACVPITSSSTRGKRLVANSQILLRVFREGSGSLFWKVLERDMKGNLPMFSVTCLETDQALCFASGASRRKPASKGPSLVSMRAPWLEQVWPELPQSGSSRKCRSQKRMRKWTRHEASVQILAFGVVGSVLSYFKKEVWTC